MPDRPTWLLQISNTTFVVSGTPLAYAIRNSTQTSTQRSSTLSGMSSCLKTIIEVPPMITDEIAEDTEFAASIKIFPFDLLWCTRWARSIISSGAANFCNQMDELRGIEPGFLYYIRNIPLQICCHQNADVLHPANGWKCNWFYMQYLFYLARQVGLKLFSLQGCSNWANPYSNGTWGRTGIASWKRVDDRWESIPFHYVFVWISHAALLTNGRNTLQSIPSLARGLLRVLTDCPPWQWNECEGFFPSVIRKETLRPHNIDKQTELPENKGRLHRHVVPDDIRLRPES